MGSIITYILAVLTLFVYCIYISVVKGVVGLLFSMAVLLISFSFIDSMEYVTSIVVLLGLTYVIITKQMTVAVPTKTTEGFNDADTGTAIVERVHGWEKAAGKGKVVGIQSVGSEGFADVSKGDEQDENSLLKTEENTGAPPPEGAPSESQPAPKQMMTNSTITSNAGEVAAQNIMKTEMADAKKGEKKIQSSPAAKAAPVAQASVASTAQTTQGFDGAPGLFKLGEMPSDTKSGPFLDVAATMGHAVDSLQPEQMAAMTQESQKLLETQKSLMGMLQSMRPVLQDGRQLLDTFSGIFGGMGGNKGLGGMLPQIDQNAGKA